MEPMGLPGLAGYIHGQRLATGQGINQPFVGRIAARVQFSADEHRIPDSQTFHDAVGQRNGNSFGFCHEHSFLQIVIS
jgi:hypothetical protein